MADAPELSKIVSVIMEHPEIIGQISSLIGSDTTGEGEAKADASAESVPTGSVSGGRRSDRARLLGAMKPYLSESRSRAVETMITVTEILENMRKGG